VRFQACRPVERKYVVRIVMPDGVHDLPYLLRELLQILHRCGQVTLHRDDKDGVCFDVLPPSNVDTKFWADHMAADFTHHGFNAVRAPECPDTLEDRQKLQHPQPASGRTAEHDATFAALVEWGEHCKR